MELDKQQDTQKMFNFNLPYEKIKVETKKEKLQKKLSKVFAVSAKNRLYSLKRNVCSFFNEYPMVLLLILTFSLVLLMPFIKGKEDKNVENLTKSTEQLSQVTQAVIEKNKNELIKLQDLQKEKEKENIKDMNSQIAKLTEKDIERIAAFMKWHEDRNVNKAINLYWSLVYVNEEENKGTINMKVVHNTIKTMINKMHDHYSYRRSDMYMNYKEIKEGKLMNVRISYDQQNVSKNTLDWLMYEKTKSTFYSDSLNELTQDKEWGGVIENPEKLVQYLEKKKNVIAKRKELFLD